jgi:hypothetical protein
VQFVSLIHRVNRQQCRFAECIPFHLREVSSSVRYRNEKMPMPEPVCYWNRGHSSISQCSGTGLTCHSSEYRCRRFRPRQRTHTMPGSRPCLIR